MSEIVFTRRAKWKEIHSPIVGTQAFTWGAVRAIVGVEPIVGWHVSISTPYRNPTWEEIRQARYDLVPDDVTMAMLLPPREEYINLHQFCFHLYQVPADKPLVFR
jgi:hypothetical protein